MQQRTFQLSHFIVLISTVLMVAGCKSKAPVATSGNMAEGTPRHETVAAGPVEVASIERTSCFGSCPIYKATFFDNGEVTYVGKNFVENIGTYTTLIPSEELEGIAQMVKDVNYFALEDAYPTPIADFPKTITSVSINGKKKSVLNGENAPRDLIGFERFLDGLLKNREWTKVSDSKTY